MISWRIALVLGLAAIAANVLQTLPGIGSPMPAAGDAGMTALAETLAAREFRSAYTLDLTRGGSHRATVYRHDHAGCEVMVVGLSTPDEVLPLMRQKLHPEAWARRIVWVSGATYRVEEAWQVHWLRLRHRLAGDHVGAGPYLLLPARTCTVGQFGIRLPS